ncbi:MAG TPA: SDR family oxidoreductase [Streptosporangiaceae bacterium]|nr:SDR family oxidoreductase [Streptosporangiaceae bacterium]
MPGSRRGTVLVTGVGRRRSIGAGLALGLAEDGWDLVLSYWAPYDDRLGFVRGEHDTEDIAAECRGYGVTVEVVTADLAQADVPERLVAAAAAAAAAGGGASGGLRGLVMSHGESVDSSILSTTVESWDRHFHVNARAAWLLIKAFAEHLPAGQASAAGGRIVALTSDHVAHNLPYGASKGALDRIVIAAAVELADRGIRANVINPGPVDTGWMTAEIRQMVLAQTPAGRLGTPVDTASLVRFLMSDAGGWINGQLLHSDGGFSTSD